MVFSLWVNLYATHQPYYLILVFKRNDGQTNQHKAKHYKQRGYCLLFLFRNDSKIITINIYCQFFKAMCIMSFIKFSFLYCNFLMLTGCESILIISNLLEPNIVNLWTFLCFRNSRSSSELLLTRFTCFRCYASNIIFVLRSQKEEQLLNLKLLWSAWNGGGRGRGRWKIRAFAVKLRFSPCVWFLDANVFSNITFVCAFCLCLHRIRNDLHCKWNPKTTGQCEPYLQQFSYKRAKKDSA